MKKLLLLTVVLIALSTSAFGQQTIQLGTSEWAPYFGSKMKNQGPIAEITKTAFEAAGYKIQIQFMDWNRAVGLAKQGKTDGILGCYNTEERAQEFQISDTIGETTLVFFSNSNADINYSSLNDLAGYKIGIVRGNAITPEFDSADFLKKDIANQTENNIKKLLAGRIDLFVESKFVGIDIINSKFSPDKEKIKVLSPPLKINTLHIGITRKNPDHQKINEALDTAIQELRGNGTMEKILKKHGF